MTEEEQRQRISLLQKERKLTDRDCANACGRTAGWWHWFKVGRVTPDLAQAQALAALLGIPVADVPWEQSVRNPSSRPNA